MKVTVRDIILVLIPAMVGYGVRLKCNIGEKAGSTVLFRPPAWVFGIAWTLLYIMLGFSWYIAQKEYKYNNYLYILLNVLLCLWLVVYSCQNSAKNAVFVLLASIITALLCFTSGNKLSQMLIAPLIGWLIFALLMNTTIVQNSE